MSLFLCLEDRRTPLVRSERPASCGPRLGAAAQTRPSASEGLQGARVPRRAAAYPCYLAHEASAAAPRSPRATDGVPVVLEHYCQALHACSLSTGTPPDRACRERPQSAAVCRTPRHTADARQLSLALRRLHRIDAACSKIRGELDDPIALGEDGRPPNHGHIAAGVGHVVDCARRFDEGAPRRQFL